MTIVAGKPQQQGASLFRVRDIHFIPDLLSAVVTNIAVVVHKWMAVVNFEEPLTLQVDDVLRGDAEVEIWMIEMLHDRNTGVLPLLCDCIEIALNYLLQAVASLWWDHTLNVRRIHVHLLVSKLVGEFLRLNDEKTIILKHTAILVQRFKPDMRTTSVDTVRYPITVLRQVFLKALAIDLAFGDHLPSLPLGKNIVI